MIRSTGIIDIKSFNKKFLKSLKSFCQKSPLQIEIFLNSTGLLSLKLNEKNIISYQINYNYLPNEEDKKTEFYVDEQVFCIKKNIKNIKNQLMPYYPVLYYFKEKSISDEEKANKINQLMVEKKLSFDQALSIIIENLKKEREKILRYKIIRVHMKLNEINVWDFKEKIKKVFKLKIPLAIFMEEVYSDIEKASILFEDKAEFISII
jgi:hypothetical protein